MIFLWLLLAAVGLTAAGIIIAANQSAYTEGGGPQRATRNRGYMGGINHGT